MFLAHFGSLSKIELRLNATVYLSNVVDHVRPFMTTVYPSFDDYFQDNAPFHKDLISGFWSMTMSSLYSNGLQSPDLNPIEHLWDVVGREICIMDVQPTNLQQLRKAIMSIWTKISEECFPHLVKSMPQRIKAEEKRGSNPVLARCT